MLTGCRVVSMRLLLLLLCAATCADGVLLDRSPCRLPLPLRVSWSGTPSACAFFGLRVCVIRALQRSEERLQHVAVRGNKCPSFLITRLLPHLHEPRLWGWYGW